MSGGDLDDAPPPPPVNPANDGARDRPAAAPASASGDAAGTNNGHAASADSDSRPPADSDQSRRPRNRTTPSWRGRARAGGSIFVRSSTARASAGAGALTRANSSVHDVSSSASGGASRDGAASSAGAAAAADDPALASTLRRRGHTLGSEGLAERRQSSAGPPEPAAGSAGDVQPVDARRVHSATTPHFHVAAENTTLSPHAYPALLGGNDNASPTSTVATVEIGGSPDPDQHTEQLSATPKGQLSKILYQEAPPDHSHEAASARAASSQARHGGSGSDSRAGDYRGAVLRQSTQGVLASRPRHASGEQPDMAGAAYDDLMPSAGMGVAIPGTAARSSADLSQYRHYAHAARRPTRAGGGPGYAAGDVAPAAGGPPVHQPTPRLARIPTLPLQTAFVGDGGAAGDRYYALQTSDTPAGIPHMQAPYSAVLPSTRDSVTPGAAGDAALSGRVLPGELGELGERIRLASSVDVHYEYQPSSHVLWGQAVRPLSVRPANPWSCVPPASSRKLVKYKIGGRWNALAAAPNGAMKCALVGSDGLFTNAMEGDGSAPPLHQLSSRRLTSAQDMNTVLWRPAYHIATGFANGHVYIWDPSRTSDGIVQKYTDSARRVNSMAYKPDDPRVIYVAHSSGEIVVWDTRTKGRRTTFHTNKATSLHDIDCNQQDANSLAAITHDGTVLTWDVRNPKKETRRIFAHNMSQGHTIAWHPSGRFIASGGNDAFIKIWDLKATSSKKLSPSAYCAIKTVGYIHKLQWRPGHDTQLASCPTSPHTYLTVWDMHNPNHSLMYHNQHSTTITGFTWYDENTVWSVGTREQLIQCDMQSDAILTSGLLPNTVADFSPNTRICVATGEHESRHGRALDWTTSQRFYASDPWPAPGTVAAAGPDSIRPASNSSSDPRRAAGADLFRPKLPCPFVDEHVLDESVLIRANVIKHLARNYRYDPDNLGECCENNARAALTARLPDMAKFWLVLSTVFGDARPLKPKRRPKAPRGRGQRSADQNNQESQLTVVATNSASVAQSAATSRSSSGVFASKSVTSIVQGSGSDDDDDDDEPAARDPARRRLVPTARSLAATSPADIRQSLSACSLGIASDGLVPHVRPGRPRYPAGTGPLDRGFMSLSHSNLQQAGAARSRSRVPSPLSRPATKAGAGPSGGCASEPATPAHHRLGQRTFQCPPAGPGAALGTAHRRAHLLGADHSAAATQNGAPPPHTSGLPHRSLLHADAAPPAGKEGVPVAMPCAERPMFALRTAADAAAAAETAGVEAAAEQARLGVESQRRVSRADLQLAVESCAYYANKGDVQTALTAALLLRRFIRISEWRAIKGWFIDYIDQLDQHQEHAVATDIILACPFPDVPDQLNDRVTIALSCIICGVKLDCHPDAGFAWCNECKHAANSCVVCQMPVQGRYIWCKGCGHGGHAEHIREWFEELGQRSCPSGCGHSCQLDPVD